jgi:hypothetical protein
MGGSYLSGSFRIDPGRVASPPFPGVREPVDTYVPSIPELSIHTEPAPASAPVQSEPATVSGAAEEENSDGGSNGVNPEYTPDELRIISDLQARDRDVRAHEQAHISAGGAYIRGGASYQYERGPDNQRYAVGGEVNIDSSPVRDNPEATIAKMQVVRSAALAPADPSAQDRAVAAAASRAEAVAHVELRERQAAEAQERNGEARQTQPWANAISAYTAPYNEQVSQQIINLAG